MKGFEKKQLEKVSSFLHKITDRLISDIKEIIVTEDYGLYDIYAKKDITYYEFKFFIPSYRIDFFPMSTDQYQLGIKKILQDYPNGFMEDARLYIDESQYNFDHDGLESLDNYCNQLQEKVDDWFNQCWIQAGGLEVTDRYSVSVYDSHNVFDLTNQKWVDRRDVF